MMLTDKLIGRRILSASWRAVRLLGALLLTVVLVVGGGYLLIEYDGNFHAVVPNAIYRSAQLDAEQLDAAIAQHRLKTVLNLRGTNVGEPWYDDEVATSRANGVLHLDFGISANHPVSVDKARAILDAIEHAPKPLLIHCKAGADRTGLVSALYLAAHGADLAQVRSQLSLRYGHVPFGTWSRTAAMDESLERFLESQRHALVKP